MVHTAHMANMRTYKVKQVARLASVSVRTLHYYDEIGLLTPSGRSNGGYRLYDEANLFRLQQVKIGRALGLSLEEIRRTLDDPNFDFAKTLRRQREKLKAQVRTTEKMIAAIDAALEQLTNKRKHNDMAMKDIFEGFDPENYSAEAESRWGHSSAYQDSVRRTQSYTPEDWEKIKAEQAKIYADAAAVLASGKPAFDADMRAIVERHRRSIDRWFYPCDIQMQLGLAGLYESDARFADNIDKHGKGLTAFLVAAIRVQESGVSAD